MKVITLITALVMQVFAVTAQNEKEIIILHTNDSHGMIFPVSAKTEDVTSQMADEGESMMKLGRTGEIGGFAVLAAAFGSKADQGKTATHTGMIEGIYGYTELSKGLNVKNTGIPLVESLCHSCFNLLSYSTESHLWLVSAIPLGRDPS